MHVIFYPEIGRKETTEKIQTRWENNIKLDSKEISYQDIGWIYSDEHNVQRKVRVKLQRTIWLPMKKALESKKLW